LEWNYGLGGSARISLGDPNDIKADIADRDTVLYNLGMRFTKERMSEVYGESLDSFEMEGTKEPGVAPGVTQEPTDETDKQKEYLNPETSEEEINGDNT
jgi:hypothetical protein